MFARAILFFRGATAAAIVLVMLGLLLISLDRMTGHDQSSLIRFGHLVGESEQHIIEIYAPDGRHNIQDPPTDTPPIVLRIPEEYRVYTSKGTIKDWGVNVMTYYPGFTSPEDPQNAKFGLRCAGYCNGRIFIHLENVGRSLKQADPAEKKYYSLIPPNAYALRLLQKKKEELLPGYHHQNLHITEFPPEADFNEIFEELITTLEDAPNIIPGHFSKKIRHYLRWNREHEYYDLVADCQIPSSNGDFEPFVCTLYFSLKCNPAVDIKITGIDGKFMPEFGNVTAEVNKFVSRMMVTPVCNS